MLSKDRLFGFLYCDIECDVSADQPKLSGSSYSVPLSILFRDHVLLTAFAQVSKLVDSNQTTWEDCSDLKFTTHRLDYFC
jgi:hypothetical protein